MEELHLRPLMEGVEAQAAAPVAPEAPTVDPGLTRKVLLVRQVRIIVARATNRLTGRGQPKPGLSLDLKATHNSGIIPTPVGIHHVPGMVI